jgi:BirA family transcriptional regulator, biotin operon repressor / biotin---[acetyl-CoA-carboxylase] ligase
LPYPPFRTSIGTPFIELQTVDSTNNYALTLIQVGRLPDLPERQTSKQGSVQHGTAVFAHEQVAGKGQRGKKWASSKDENIALSIVLNPIPLRVAQQFQLSACIALAVCTFFQKYTGEDTRIKWPNDLYWKDRKAGGILIENIVGSMREEAGNKKSEEALWKWAVIGIGININQTSFPEDLVNPASLKQITGKNFEPVELAKELCGFIDHYYHALISKGFDNILSLYLSHFYKKDETVKLKKDNRVFEAVIKGISPEGKLIVQHSMEEQFDLGEIQWLL